MVRTRPLSGYTRRGRRRVVGAGVGGSRGTGAAAGPEEAAGREGTGAARREVATSAHLEVPARETAEPP